MKTGKSIVLTAGDRSVPWLSELPPSWHCKPLKYLAAINTRTLGEETPLDFQFRYIDISSVNSEGEVLEATEMIFENAPSRARRILTTGDVFLSTVRTYLTAIAFCPERYNGFICSTGFAVITPRKLLVTKFVYYWTRSTYFVGEIVARSTGVSYPAINASEIGNLPCPVLPLDKQQAIADFLDRKTTQIDGVIAKKQRMIDLLHEKRQALISEAVTKGLDPDVPTKDSGIEWLGRVPRHWSLLKVGQATRVVRGASPRPAGSPTYFNGDAAPWITVAEVTKDLSKHLTSTETRLTHLGQTLSRYLESGTLIMTNSGATLGVPKILAIGGCINDGSVALLDLRKEIEQDFLFHFLSSLTRMLRERAEGQGQPNLNTDIVRALPLPLPPLEEQRGIVVHVEEKTGRTLNGINLIESQIAKLREYRQTLISAAVTGQIDVTEEVQR